MFDLPPVHGDTAGALRPRRLREWLRLLLEQEPLTATRRFLVALRAQNRSALSAANRRALLDTLAPAARRLAVSLGAYTGNGALLDPQARSALDLLLALEQEMLLAHKRVLADGNPPGEGVLIGALGHASGGLLAAYRGYRIWPSGLWRDAHRIYVLGAGFEELETLYLRLLLVGTSNPFGLFPGELDRVWELSGTLAQDAELLNVDSPSDAAGCFLLVTDADAPPLPLPSQLPMDPEGLRILDLSAVLARLGDAESSTGPDPWLRTRLEHQWNGARRRRFHRQAPEEGSRLFLHLGLDASWQLLSGEDPLGTAYGARSYLDLDHLVEVSGDRVAGVADVQAPPMGDWQLRDEGAGGISMRRLGAEQEALRVGDLAAVTNGDDSVHFGVLRWLRTGGEWECGLEWLGPGLRAVRFSADGMQGIGIWLPSNSLRKGETLLLPAGSQGRIQDLRIDCDGEAFRVRPGQVIAQGSDFERLTFTRLSDPAPA
ncbi:MAG: hypothetical protein LJE84_00550 [Gammaproteobacteria bacterium]|nr:hypothetical protein [Gammaproteobacteria bacterium]